jgi:uncharacterized membrane protein YebE (DUF533 family)
MVDTTKILTELLGGGGRGNGGLASQSGAKMLEDLLGVGKSGGQQSGGGIFGGDQQRGGGGVFGGGDNSDRNTGGGIFGGSDSGAGSGGLGDLLGKALRELGNKQGRGGAAPGDSNNPFDSPTQLPDNASQSEVYLRAMIQAAMADGGLDEQEQQAILKRAGNVGRAEADFIRAEMARGTNVQSFIQTVPRGIEEKVYAMSLMAIQLDNQTEAQFLHALAQGLRITEQQSNAIHDQMGAQRLYR